MNKLQVQPRHLCRPHLPFTGVSALLLKSCNSFQYPLGGYKKQETWKEQWKQLVASTIKSLIRLCVVSLFLQFSAILFCGTAVLARTYYVQPSSEVVVRTGQGNSFKIIAMVKNGASVEFLEADGDYAKVRLANGKKGWMLKRFLSEEPPLKEIVVSLRAEKEEMKQKEIKTEQKFEAISSTLTQTEKELDSTLEERNQIRADYQTLQENTANVIQIKNNLQKTAKENKMLAEKLALMEQESENLKNDTALKWFLAGGGVLLIGIIIGRVTSRSRRRKPSLL
ncbi:MAG: TIGR04211 family SH3 domain-containing protein [Thermodesulfobacteriota bacterium]|nr:TIGR04211 family SH3 domain-containing protein [Thermodesulfobacteriota bacterium]